MDVISKFESHEDVFKVLHRTIAAFRPTLEANEALLDFIARRKTFKFGPTDRHKLDVFYPATSMQPPPIIFIIYAGGFVSGDRILPPPNSIGWANVGAFFASQGFLAIIPDYRLAPAFKYPTGAVDVRDAIDWTTDNVDKINPRGGADTHNMFVVATSAGVAHAMAVAMSPDLPRNPASRTRSLKGLILIGGAFENFVELKPVTVAYFGSLEAAKGKDAIGWLNEESARRLPPMFIVLGEYETSYITRATKDFVKGLHSYGRVDVQITDAKGHNHVSPFWALGTNDQAAEEWAHQAVAWTRRV